MQVILSKLVNNYTEFNINQNVCVKLTDFGKEILQRRREVFNDFLISRGEKPLYTDVIETDKDGYTKLQLWEVMNIFGSYINIDEQMPFETTIRICNK